MSSSAEILVLSTITEGCYASASPVLAVCRSVGSALSDPVGPGEPILAAFRRIPIHLPAWSGIDGLAAALILAGVLCQLLHRRFPAALGSALFACAATIGTAIAAVHHYWPAVGAAAVVARVAALLCMAWAFFGWLAALRAAPPRPSTGEETPAGSRAPLVHAARSPAAAASSAAFFAWALVLGIAVVVMTGYIMTFEVADRLLNPDRIIERLDASGLWNLVALLLATLLWAAAAPRSHPPTISLILAAVLVVWTSLMIPSTVGSYERIPGAAAISAQPEWWGWSFQMEAGLSLLLLIAATLQEWRYRSRRGRAWPDRLNDLLEPYSRWPGFIQSEAVIAAIVLLLGVYHIVRPGPPYWQLALANCIAPLGAGWTCLFMTYRRWSANTAGLGISLVSLAAVSLAAVPVYVFGGQTEAGEYAARLPVIYNAALFALALMIAWWSWLVRFWEQQLLDGIPWTTTGRMIPHARRAAFLLTAIAVLVAYQMALWPGRPLAGAEDDSPARLICGVSSLLLLALLSAREARRTHGDTAAASGASLSIAFFTAAAIFVFMRLPASAFRGWLRQYDSVALSAAALPLLILAESLVRTSWRCFATPLWWVALLALPAAALAEMLAEQRPASEWIRPSTFALLGTLYVLAGLREHRRAILILGGVLFLAALTTVLRNYGMLG